MTAMRRLQFAFWLAQMLLGFACFMGGLELARLYWTHWWEGAAGGAAAALLGLALMVLAELRERPQRVLRRARRTLNLPTQWAVKFDKTLPRGGVVPLAVIRSDGVRFVIDIQAFRSAEWNDEAKGGEDVLVDSKGRKFAPDPVAPLMRAAEVWGATPVLWLPATRHMRNLRRDGCQLIVVMGSARELKHALRGAEIVARHGDDESTSDMPRARSRRAPALAPMRSPEMV
jgi:hypothetical protein